MAIDADLNAGALTTEEAKLRREEISKEADFYGSMDGASKFVKGDAIAGILILIINILGGLIIGIWLHGLGIEEAANTYFLLSVGDGLVAQNTFATIGYCNSDNSHESFRNSRFR